MSNHASNAGRHARRGAKQLRHRAEEARNGVMDTVHKMGNEAVGAIRDGYDDLRETASDYVSQGRERVGDFERSIEKRVKQNPDDHRHDLLGPRLFGGLPVFAPLTTYSVRRKGPRSHSGDPFLLPTRDADPIEI